MQLKNTDLKRIIDSTVRISLVQRFESVATKCGRVSLLRGRKKGLPLTQVVSQKFYKKSRFILDPCQNKIMEIVFTLCIRLYSRFPYVSNFPICIQTILTYSVFHYTVFFWGVPPLEASALASDLGLQIAPAGGPHQVCLAACSTLTDFTRFALNILSATQYKSRRIRSWLQSQIPSSLGRGPTSAPPSDEKQLCPFTAGRVTSRSQIDTRLIGIAIP